MTRLAAIETYYRTLRSKAAAERPGYTKATMGQTRRWFRLVRKGMHIGGEYTLRIR